MGKSFEARLLGDIEGDLARFEKKIQEKVLIEGAAGMAKVLYDEVKLNASPPRLGRVTGNLENSIYRVYSPERSGDALKTYRISWNKKKAPHGHLIEFGTSRMAAKPFVRPAFDHMEAAIKVGMARMKAKLEGTA